MHFFQVVKHKNNKQNIDICISIYIHIYISINAYALNRHRTRPVWTSLSRVVECGIVCVCAWLWLQPDADAHPGVTCDAVLHQQLYANNDDNTTVGRQWTKDEPVVHTHTHPRPFDCPPPDHLFSCLATNYGDTKRKEALQNVQVLRESVHLFGRFNTKYFALQIYECRKLERFSFDHFQWNQKKNENKNKREYLNEWKRQEGNHPLWGWGRERKGNLSARI